MTVKLHVATRKLLTPTSTGIFCRSRNGASIGSGASASSTSTKRSAKTPLNVSGTKTEGEDHYERLGADAWKGRGGTYRVLFAESRAKEDEEGEDLE